MNNLRPKIFPCHIFIPNGSQMWRYTGQQNVDGPMWLDSREAGMGEQQVCGCVFFKTSFVVKSHGCVCGCCSHLHWFLGSIWGRRALLLFLNAAPKSFGFSDTLTSCNSVFLVSLHEDPFKSYNPQDFILSFLSVHGALLDLHLWTVL